MSVSRFLFSLLLAFALSAAPVLHGLAKAALPAANAASGTHTGHVDSAHHHDTSKGSCAQHDACKGQCCTSCSHFFAGVSLLQVVDDYTRSVMTPAVTQLVLSPLVFARERPPRFFRYRRRWLQLLRCLDDSLA